MVSVFELGLEFFDEVVNPIDEHHYILKSELKHGLDSVFCPVLRDDQVRIIFH